MKIALLQDCFRPCRIEENKKKIADFYKKASQEDADIVVVPSEAICGFEPEGLLDFNDVNDALTDIQKELIRSTNADTALVFDTPFALDGSFSPSLIIAYDGCIQHSLPQFDISPDWAERIITFHDESILFTFFSSIASLHVTQAMALMELIDTCIILDARPFTQDKELSRCQVLSNLALGIRNVIYANQSGFQNGYMLGGASCYYQQGKLRVQLPYFDKSESIFDTEETEWKRVQTLIPDTKEKMTKCLHHAVVAGIRDYFSQCGVSKAVVGLSGGIDSAVVLPLAVEALGRKNVFGIMMPSQFSTDHSVKDAVQLAENLQIHYEIIPIEPVYKAFMQQLEPIVKGTPFGLTEENLQARIRGTILMAAANKQGAFLLNTSNKSEASCGYGTLYGDLCGALSVLGDLYKSQVYDIARLINKRKEIIPENSIRKAPSAELHPGQKDSDSLPDYDTIEKVLRLHLEQKLGQKEIEEEGVSPKSVKRILDLFYKNVFKRHQTPPVIRLSQTCLDKDINLPLVCR
mgnify:FL=1